MIEKQESERANLVSHGSLHKRFKGKCPLKGQKEGGKCSYKTKYWMFLVHINYIISGPQGEKWTFFGNCVMLCSSIALIQSVNYIHQDVLTFISILDCKSRPLFQIYPVSKTLSDYRLHSELDYCNKWCMLKCVRSVFCVIDILTSSSIAYTDFMQLIQSHPTKWNSSRVTLCQCFQSCECRVCSLFWTYDIILVTIAINSVEAHNMS